MAAIINQIPVRWFDARGTLDYDTVYPIPASELKRLRTRMSNALRVAPTRLQILLWAAVMLGTLALLAYNWTSYQVGTYGDDGSYVSVTDSLLQGIPYGTLLDTDLDDPTQFPFVYPLILAPLRAFFPNDLNALRYVSVLATLGVLAVLFWAWRWLGRGLSYWWGLAVVALTGFSPLTLLHGHTVMSEALFLLFWLLLIVWTEYVAFRAPRAWGILFGLVSVALVYTRLAGLVIVAAALLYLFWKMRRAVWKQLGVAAVAAAAPLALILLTTSVRPVDLLPNEYMNQLAAIYDGDNATNEEVARRVLESADDSSPIRPENPIQRTVGAIWYQLDFADKLPFQLERAVISTTDALGISFVRRVPFLVLLALVVLGLVVWVRRSGVTLFFLALPAYGFLLIAWSWQGPRLVYPIQPQLFLAVLLALAAVTAWLTGRLRGDSRRVTAAVLGAITGVWLLAWLWLDLNLSRTMVLPGNQIARAAILAQYLPADARVLSTRAEVDYLYTPRRFYDFPRGLGSPARLRQFLLEKNFDYVVAPSGVETTPENDSLRISRVQRFVVYLQPLIQEGFLVAAYDDPVGDLAIYRVRQE
jgi:hypothetical protein